MTDQPGRTPRPLSPFRLFGQRKMMGLLFLGFSSGLPLYLTSRTLQAWMTLSGVDLKTIGMFSLMTVPYSLKFLVAPIFDRFIPPILGRRRGWILIMQILLIVSVAWMSTHDPKHGLQLLAINALLIAIFSASQDVVVDAYRIDALDDFEMAGGASMYVVGYRIALIITAAVAFILADRINWPSTYLVLSSLMLIGVIGNVFIAPEPILKDRPPQTFKDSVVLPFEEFFTRTGLWKGFAVLLFIVLYKLSDAMVTNMATPFLLKTGFTQTTIGEIAGGVGLTATIVGALVGGAIAGRIGINRSLWVFGILQALSNTMYYFLAVLGKNYGFLVATMVIENFCIGLITAGFLAFMASLCSVRFSATQYALISSLMSTASSFLTAPTGALASHVGWPHFFLICVAVALPPFLFLPMLAPWNMDRPTVAAPHEGETEAKA